MVSIDSALHIPGWMSPQELSWLAEQASKAHNILEVGSWRGRSARAFAENTSGTLTCVDTWDDKAIGIPGWWSTPQDAKLQQQYGWLRRTFEENLEEYIENKVFMIQRESLDAAQFLARRGRKFDLIFIDADHSLEAVKQDIFVWSRLLTDAGIICGHDYGQHDCSEVKPAVDLIFPQVDVIGTIWVPAA